MNATHFRYRGQHLRVASSKRQVLHYVLEVHLLVSSFVPSRVFASPIVESSPAAGVPTSADTCVRSLDPISSPSCDLIDQIMAGQRVAAFSWQMLDQNSRATADASGSFLSPISLYVALGLALNGAGPGSDTQQELFHLLHQDKSRLLGLVPPKAAEAADVEQLTTALAALSDSLVQQQLQQGDKPGGCAELIIANSVWTKGIAVREQYAAKMLQLFKAEVREVRSVDPINEWAARVTKGLITTAVPPGTPFDLVLTNAVYFKGLWEYAFKKEATTKQAFRLERGGAEVQVDMMTKRFKASEQAAQGARKVQWVDMGRYQAVRLPYKGSTISAVIVLPSEQLAAQGIAAAAVQLDIVELLDASKYRNVGPAGLDVLLPKFKVKTEPTSLKKELVALGLSTPFNKKTADFGQLSPQPLYISDVLQSVCVIVDEEGTEAAAVTAVIMMRASAVMAATPVIRFDRPFLFMLVDDASSTPLFVGTVTDPSKSPA